MCKILIVDDEPHIASFIKRGLRKQRIKAEVASDGAQALQILNNDEYDLVLLDLGLPIKSGWAVLQELRNQGNLVPIIVMTASDVTLTQAVQAGANDCVLKPFSFSEMLAVIERESRCHTAWRHAS